MGAIAPINFEKSLFAPIDFDNFFKVWLIQEQASWRNIHKWCPNFWGVFRGKYFPICSQISGGRISKNWGFGGRILWEKGTWVDKITWKDFNAVQLFTLFLVRKMKQNLDFQQYFGWKVCLKSNLICLYTQKSCNL